MEGEWRKRKDDEHSEMRFVDIAIMNEERGSGKKSNDERKSMVDKGMKKVGKEEKKKEWRL